MWGLGVLPAALPAPFSATLSPALLAYLRECGAAGSASGQTACPVSPTLLQSRSHHGNGSPLRPGCPSPPLLLVWMNVYFLISLVSDFLAVRFSVSSGCARRHSVSTYAAILVLPIFLILIAYYMLITMLVMVLQRKRDSLNCKKLPTV